MEVGGPPEGNGRRYYRYEEDGLTVFVPAGMLVMGPAIRLRLAGFWKFRWLRVEGVAPVPGLGCAS